MTVEEAIAAQHTTRAFTDRVPDANVISEALASAQRSPSSTNVQPWNVTIATGPVLSQLKRVLVDNFDHGKPLEVAPLPASFQHFRQQLGKEVYGPQGYNIAYGEAERIMTTNRSNFEFYGAPMVAVIGVDSALNDADTLSVGLYLQTLMLLLIERGLATGVSVATAGYHKQIRATLGIADTVKILCTLHIGYEDESAPINKLRMSRRDYQDCVRFIDSRL